MKVFAMMCLMMCLMMFLMMSVISDDRLTNRPRDIAGCRVDLVTENILFSIFFTEIQRQVWARAQLP